MRPLLLLVILAGAALIGGCDSKSPQEVALQVNRDKWESSGITSYRYILTYQCPAFCEPPPQRPITITVQDKEFQSAEAASIRNMTSSQLSDAVRPFSTAELIFERIDRSLSVADEASASYYDNGFPMAVGADWYVDAVDDEWSASFSDFEVLP